MMRYLTKLCDQLISLFSANHSQMIVLEDEVQHSSGEETAEGENMMHYLLFTQMLGNTCFALITSVSTLTGHSCLG